MAEVTTYNKTKLDAIDNATIVSGAVDSTGHLKLTKKDSSVLDVGPVLAPSGSVVMSAATAVPSGWLLCNGAEISRTTYSDLFAAIGTAYGAGNGTSTFNVPNLEAKFPRMQAASRGGTGGGATHTHTVTIPVHAHTIEGGSTAAHARIMISGTANPNFWERRIAVAAYNATVAGQLPSGVTNTDSVNQGAEVLGVTATTSLTPTVGATVADLPPYVNLNFIIKT